MKIGTTQQEQDQYWMAQAMRLAKQAEAIGEIPVGALLVKDNQLIASGFNQSIINHDPSAHAEMQCLRQAGQALENYRLIGTTLYVTLEPCAMCAGALIHSRVQRVVFGVSDYKTGVAGSVINLFEHAIANYRIEVQGGVLAQECSQLLSDFFRRRRSEKKAEKKATKQASPQ